MKKRLSLILAIMMIATMMLSVIPFGAFAEDPVEYEARIGSVLYDTFEQAIVDVGTPGMFESDVTITLLKNVEIAAPGLIFACPRSAETNDVAYQLTIDGDGHKFTGSINNMISMGYAARSGEKITLKDIDINFSGATGAVIHFYATGVYLLEDVNIVCSSPVEWGVINSNTAWIENETIDVTMNDVTMIQPAYGGPNRSNFVAGGNGGDDAHSPNVNYVFNDCNLSVANTDWWAGGEAVQAIWMAHDRMSIELNNSVVTSRDAAIYFESAISDNSNVRVKVNSTKLTAINYNAAVAGGNGLSVGTVYFTDNAAGSTVDAKTRPLIHSRSKNTIISITGEYVEPTGEAQLVTADARTPYATLAEAITAAKASTVDCSIVLTADIALDAAIAIEAANNQVTVTFDGNDHKITTAVENAIKVGAAGAEANIDVIDLDVEYTGSAAAIQVNAIGNVNFYDVTVNTGATAAAALDVAAANAAVVLTDVNFIGTTAAAIKTVDGLAAAVKIYGSALVANENVELYNDIDAVDYDANCWLVGEEPAGAVVTTTETPATTTTEAPAVTTTEAPATTTATAEAPATTTANAPEADTTTKAPDAATTTKAPAATTKAPEAGTTAAPEAEGDCAGCGGIAIAAQLVALVCAAAVIVIKKK